MAVSTKSLKSNIDREFGTVPRSGERKTQRELFDLEVAAEDDVVNQLSLTLIQLLLRLEKYVIIMIDLFSHPLKKDIQTMTR